MERKKLTFEINCLNNECKLTLIQRCAIRYFLVFMKLVMRKRKKNIYHTTFLIELIRKRDSVF